MIKMARLRDCKLWDKCPNMQNNNRACEDELKTLYGKDWRKGSVIWSKELCYTLADMKEKGLIKESSL